MAQDEPPEHTDPDQAATPVTGRRGPARGRRACPQQTRRRRRRV